jgi:hypothetical protein
MKCEHKKARVLECEEHKGCNDCCIVICCDCGETIEDEIINTQYDTEDAYLWIKK